MKRRLPKYHHCRFQVPQGAGACPHVLREHTVLYEVLLVTWLVGEGEYPYEPKGAGRSRPIQGPAYSLANDMAESADPFLPLTQMACLGSGGEQQNRSPSRCGTIGWLCHCLVIVSPTKLTTLPPAFPYQSTALSDHTIGVGYSWKRAKHQAPTKMNLR